jgi:hypothetical protein
LLAALLLLNPVEADCVTSSLDQGLLYRSARNLRDRPGDHYDPLIYAQRQTRLQPEKYQPRLLTKVTWTMIGFNIVCNVAMFSGYFARVQ